MTDDFLATDMGMCAYFREISPSLLEALVSNPSLALAVLALGRPSMEEEATRQLASLPVEARAQAAETFDMLIKARDCFPVELGRQAAGLRALQQAGFTKRDCPTVIDIEKRWRGLHEVLEQQPEEGSPRPGYAVTGGTEVGEDLGYGTLRYLTAPRVRSTADQLESISLDELAARVAATPGGDPDDFEWYWETLQKVTRYYAGARARGFGMLLYFA